MRQLESICAALGFQSIRTYIQTGNVAFESRSSEPAIRLSMEKALAANIGKKIDVMLRTSAEMRLVLNRNPFSEQERAKVAVAFVPEAPPKDLMKNVIAPGGEQVQRGRREIYV